MKKQNTQVANPSGSQAIVRSRKPYDELTIVDDFMFCKVMQDEKLCKELLRRILTDEIGEIRSVEVQKVMDDSYNAHGIRVDIIVTTEDGRVYDIEMQASNRKYLSKRIRYYQSVIDYELLDKGQSYKKLPDTYIIFLCPFDYPGRGLPVYTYKSICKEDKSITLNDGVTKIILNSTASEKAESKELRAVLDYMNGRITDDPYIEELEQAVATAKRNEQWRKDYNMNSAWYMDAVEDGIEIGEERGREQGLEQGREQGLEQGLNALFSLVEQGRITEEEAAQSFNMPLEDFRAKREQAHLPV